MHITVDVFPLSSKFEPTVRGSTMCFLTHALRLFGNSSTCTIVYGPIDRGMGDSPKFLRFPNLSTSSTGAAYG